MKLRLCPQRVRVTPLFNEPSLPTFLLTEQADASQGVLSVFGLNYITVSCSLTVDSGMLLLMLSLSMRMCVLDVYPPHALFVDQRRVLDLLNIKIRNTHTALPLYRCNANINRPTSLVSVRFRLCVVVLRTYIYAEAPR